MFLNNTQTGVSIGVILVGILLSGCATPKHALPEVQDNRVSAAAAEINAAPDPVARAVSDEEAVARISALYNKLKPAGTAVCRYVGEHHCDWELTYSPEEEVNAYASDAGTVVIYKGIVQYARSDAEIAMVIAHEMAHHIANHIRESQNSQAVGALVGGVAMALLLGDAAMYNSQVISDGMQIGA